MSTWMVSWVFCLHGRQTGMTWSLWVEGQQCVQQFFPLYNGSSQKIKTLYLISVFFFAESLRNLSVENFVDSLWSFSCNISLRCLFTDPLPFTCSRCGRGYSVQYTMERHLKYECGVAKQFACAICLRKFARRDVLRVHEKTFKH